MKCVGVRGGSWVCWACDLTAGGCGQVAAGQRRIASFYYPANPVNKLRCARGRRGQDTPPPFPNV